MKIKEKAVTQPGKEKVSRSAKNSAHGSLFCIVHFYYTVLVITLIAGYR